MKIGFIVHRTIYYKYFGPIIDEALRRGHEVACLHDYSQPKTGMKWYSFPYLESAPSFRFGVPHLISFNGDDEFLKMVEKHNIDVLVSIHFLPQYIDLYNKLKKEGVFWVAIQHTIDTIAVSEYLSMPDRYITYSDATLDWALYYLSNQGVIRKQDVSDYKEKLKSKVKSIGLPELDQLNMIDPKEVRREWDIPDEKTVVLLLPFPFGSSSDKFWAPFIYGMDNHIIQLPIAMLSLKIRYMKQVVHRWNDKNVVKSVKKFCEKNNAYLLVKSRLKDPVRNYLSSVADKVLYDESYYPADILKCLSISDMCINFLSTTVTEAIPAGVPNICISPDPRDYADIRTSLGRMIFNSGAKEIFDFPGASYMLSIPEAVDTLPNKSIQDFPLDSNRQKEYIKKFVGYSDGKSAYRALNEIEKILDEKES